MHGEMSTLKSLGNAPPSWSTVQHSRDLTFQGSCHLEDGYRIAASAYGSAAVNAQESQYLEPSYNHAVSALQLSSYPIASDPRVLAGSPNLVGHLSRESNNAQVALSLGHVAGQNRASSIDSPFVDHTRGYSDMQVHPSDYITNHNTALPPSYPSPLPPSAMEQSSGYPQVIGDVSTSGDPDNIFTAPTMGLDPVLSPHDGTVGQVTGLNAPWPRLPNSAAPPPQELQPSDDFAIGNVPLPPEQGPFFESDSAQVALSLGHVAGQNRASLIDSPFVDHTRGYSDMQVHASAYVTNHNTALPPSHPSLPAPYAIEQSSGYPQVIRDVSTSGDPDNIFTAPTMGLGPVLSPHDRSTGQVTRPNAPWPRLPNSAAPPPQALQQSDDFAIGNVPLPPNQAPFFNTHHALKYIPGHQSLTSIPSQSNSMSYSTSHGYSWPHPSFPMPNRNSPSWFQQEHPGYPSSVQLHYARPVGSPGFHGGVGGLGGRYEGDGHHELSHHGATQYPRQMHRHYSRLQGATRSYSIALNTESKVHGDHPSHTLSGHKTHSFYNRAAYAPDDRTTGGAVDDYGNFDESEVNLEQVVGLPPQLPLPPNQLPLSPRKLRSHDRVSSIRGRSLSRTSRRMRRSATAQSPLNTRPPLVCCRKESISCKWRDDTGSECGADVNCGNLKQHLISAHGINNTGENTEIICRWCPSERSKGVVRRNLPRHVKEVHLGCPRGH